MDLAGEPERVKELINRSMRMTWFAWPLLAAWMAVLPAEASARQDSLQPADWNRGMRLPEATDLNPDPNVFETNLEAKVALVEFGPGQSVEAWTYDGGLPGPLIRVKAGDRLVVHFKNTLPSPTTVHWHGLRVPIEMDGVPGISQPEVQTGGTFTYDFVVPDAGLFWYHPHVMSAAQVGFGLYGPLLVEDPDDTVGIADELVLVLSDIGIAKDGTLDSPESGGTTAMAFGREGQFVLINGRRDSSMVARSGAPQRWRIVNTAKSRYFNLDLSAGNTFTKIGGDGGLQEYATESDFLVLGPGERADVLVAPRGKPGSELTVLSQLFDRGYGSTEFRLPEDLFHIRFADLPEMAPQPLPKPQRVIEPLDTAGATPVELNLTIIQRREDKEFEYHINNQPWWKATPIRASVGETQLWTVKNETPWSHPLHLHGFFFQVLDENGNHVRPIEWKDTVHIPFKDAVRLLVRYDDREGNWMVHCHILDHAEGGLMTTVQLGNVAPAEHSH
jgi:FtsP/CotA-like multicopper oxidase with cupredoxin domain